MAIIEECRSAFKILTDKPKAKGLLGIHRRRWEDNNTIDQKYIVINTRNWVDSAQDKRYWRALVNAAMNLWIP